MITYRYCCESCGHEFEEETQTQYRVGQRVPVQVNAVINKN